MLDTTNLKKCELLNDWSSSVVPRHRRAKCQYCRLWVEFEVGVLDDDRVLLDHFGFGNSHWWGWGVAGATYDTTWCRVTMDLPSLYFRDVFLTFWSNLAFLRYETRLFRVFIKFLIEAKLTLEFVWTRLHFCIWVSSVFHCSLVLMAHDVTLRFHTRCNRSRLEGQKTPRTHHRRKHLDSALAQNGLVGWSCTGTLHMPFLFSDGGSSIWGEGCPPRARLLSTDTIPPMQTQKEQEDMKERLRQPAVTGRKLDGNLICVCHVVIPGQWQNPAVVACRLPPVPRLSGDNGLSLQSCSPGETSVHTTSSVRRTRIAALTAQQLLAKTTGSAKLVIDDSCCSTPEAEADAGCFLPDGGQEGHAVKDLVYIEFI